MTRADYSRAEIIARARELYRGALFATWGEAMAAAYWEHREATRPTSKIAISQERVNA